jgi:hypothetical protein
MASIAHSKIAARSHPGQQSTARAAVIVKPRPGGMPIAFYRNLQQ